MLQIFAYDLGHTSHKRIRIEGGHHLFVQEVGNGNAAKHLGPLFSLLGVDIFHEGARAQIQILHTPHGEGHALLHQAVQTATCGYHVHPRQILVEIAQQGHRLGLFLNFIDK